VYGKEGEQCPRCSALIQRRVQQGRPTFFCPTCQS
jgi:formamidopyrimidine-DNA glycosylase